MDQKGAGLKKPVMINIDDMPQKLDIELEAEPHGLQGNRQRLDIYIDKAQNINLNELKIKIADIQENFSSNQKSQPQGTNLMHSVNMANSLMDASAITTMVTNRTSMQRSRLSSSRLDHSTIVVKKKNEVNPIKEEDIFEAA